MTDANDDRPIFLKPGHNAGDLLESREWSILREERGLTQVQAEAIVAAQATDEERLALADVVLDSSQALEQTQQAAAELYEALRSAWPARLSSVPPRFPSVAL